jgi:hypothetical protein
MHRLVVLAVVAACGSPPPPSTPPRVLTPLERARVYELASARDYARAAEIYATACADGKGDLPACRKLVEVLVDGRGA